MSDPRLDTAFVDSAISAPPVVVAITTTLVVLAAIATTA